MALASVDSALDDPAFLEPQGAKTRMSTATNVRITHRATSSTTTTTTTTSHSPTSMASIAPADRATQHKAATSTKSKTEADADADAAVAQSEAKTETEAAASQSSVYATFKERYLAATACKMYEVEELIDYCLHRRLAAITAVIISTLPIKITPNQITLFGLVFGWGAATCLYDAQFHTPLGWEPTKSFGMASLLMFMWIVSDCADGQVARLCHRGTRTGRFFDGLIDLLVMAANCVVLGWVVADRYGQEYMKLATFAGLSLWLHCITYDKIKNKYMENALPQSECAGESVESVKAELRESYAKHPFSLETILFAIYVVYLAGQAVLTSDVESIKKEHKVNKPRDEQARRAYQKKFAHVIRLTSWMGLSAHVTGMYVGYFFAMFDFAALYYLMLYFGIVLNVILVLSWIAYHKSGMGSATAASMAAP